MRMTANNGKNASGQLKGPKSICSAGLLFVAAALGLATLGSTIANAAVGEPAGYMNQRFVQPSWVKHSANGSKRTSAPGKQARKPSGLSRHVKKRFKSKTARNKSRGIKVAAIGKGEFQLQQPTTPVTGSGIRWTASSGCLNGVLIAVVYQVAANFGPVTVNSTCRSRKRNARVGGARRSHHLTGNAVDFRVRGNIRGVYAFLRSTASVGGLKHYGGGLFHIDTGDRRSW